MHEFLLQKIIFHSGACLFLIWKWKKKQKKLWLVFQKRKVKLATLMNLNPKSSWKKEHLMRPLKRFEQGLSSPKHFVHVIFNLKSKCI